MKRKTIFAATITNTPKYRDWETSTIKPNTGDAYRRNRKMKRFRNTDLWYQGTYELDFLERY